MSNIELIKPMEIKPFSFIYVRHGQTDWNLQKRAMGQKDIPLNQFGIEQAVQARKFLKNHPIETICYSPLIRAKKTAEIINESFNCRMVCIDELKEFNLGQFEGQVKGKWFEDWKSGKNESNVESYDRFLKRALQGINLALGFSPNVLIVAHGGVYWAVQRALKLAVESDLANGIPMLHIPPQNNETAWNRFAVHT